MDRALAMILAPVPVRLVRPGWWMGLEEAGVAEALMVPLWLEWLAVSSLGLSRMADSLALRPLGRAGGSTLLFSETADEGAGLSGWGDKNTYIPFCHFSSLTALNTSYSIILLRLSLCLVGVCPKKINPPSKQSQYTPPLESPETLQTSSQCPPRLPP